MTGGLIERIEPFDKRRSKVFLEGDFAFLLYGGEIRQYGLEPGMILSESRYEEILALLGKRARERALYELKSRDRTEQEIRRKLARDLYPEQAVEQTVSFLKVYGYVDDVRFAEHYVEIYGRKKSQAELLLNLQKKGIDRETAKSAVRKMEEVLDPGAAPSAVETVLQKRKYGLSEEANRKTIAYLQRRGFSWEEIRRGIENYSQSKTDFIDMESFVE